MEYGVYKKIFYIEADKPHHIDLFPNKGGKGFAIFNCNPDAKKWKYLYK